MESIVTPTGHFCMGYDWTKFVDNWKETTYEKNINKSV